MFSEIELKVGWDCKEEREINENSAKSDWIIANGNKKKTERWF